MLPSTTSQGRGETRTEMGGDDDHLLTEASILIDMYPGSKRSARAMDGRHDGSGHRSTCPGMKRDKLEKEPSRLRSRR